MALISDPRVFAVPTFHFEKDGTFVDERGSVRPTPDQLFDCRQVAQASIRRQLSWRKDIDAWSIVWGQGESSAICATSISKDLPMFLLAELLRPDGKTSLESTYEDVWMRRRSARVAYFAFGEKSRPVPMTAKGRLLDISLYLQFFEADDGAADELIGRLEQQSLKEVVRVDWDQLMETITVDLLGGRVSFSNQLAGKYRTAARVFGCLS